MTPEQLIALQYDIEMDNLREQGYDSPRDKKFVEELANYGKPKEEAL